MKLAEQKAAKRKALIGTKLKKKKEEVVKSALASSAKTVNKIARKRKPDDGDEKQVVTKKNDSYVNQMFKTLEEPEINDDGVIVYGIKGKNSE